MSVYGSVGGRDTLLSPIKVEGGRGAGVGSVEVQVRKEGSISTGVSRERDRLAEIETGGPWRDGRDGGSVERN